MRYLFIPIILAVLASCGSDLEPPTAAALTGQQLADKYLIVDTHIDVPFRLHRQPQDVGAATDSGEFDYPRAVAGGLNAAFMSIYIPAQVEEDGGAKALADELIDLVEGIISQHPDKFAAAHSTAQIVANIKAGLISLPMGMENGGPIQGDLNNVSYFFDRGIRYITLTHSRSNHISDSSYDENKRWGGLSDFGKALIPEMNRLGLLVDVSHISDIGSAFISVASSDSGRARSTALTAYVEANDIAADSEAYNVAKAKIDAEHPYVYATMDDVLDHIDHIVAVAGINHVGIGSDFDGVGDSLPMGFKDVSQYPAFIDGLISRGYSEKAIEQILGGNLMRVWRANEAHALALRLAAQAN